MRVQSVAFSLTITLCLALAAAGLAFVAGRQAAEPETRYEHGVEEGERVGRREGRRAGARQFETVGRNRVFDDFTGGWDVGRWYLVNIGPGQDGARYAINARVKVSQRTSYRVCRDVQICQTRR